jgi:Zn/Cd-binding protein ZinT
MRKTKWILAVLVMALAFFGCQDKNNKSSELTKWVGTWNSMNSFLDESWMESTFNEGVEYIQNTHSKTISAEQIKNRFAQMLRSDFASCVIEGDKITFYTQKNAAGTPTAITYTFKKKMGGSEEKGEKSYWYAFEGDTSDKYKYLVVLLPEQDGGDQMIHFHFRYAAESFDTLFNGENKRWYATLAKQGTTEEQVKKSIKSIIEGMPWGAILP